MSDNLQQTAPSDYYLRAAKMLETLRNLIGSGYGENDIEHITDVVVARLRDWDRLDREAIKRRILTPPAPPVAVKPALSAAEPVAWQYSKGDKLIITTHHQPWKTETGWAVTPLYAAPPAPPVAVNAEGLAQQIWGYFKGDSTGGTSAIQWFDNNKSLGGPAYVIALCRSALSAQVQDVAAYLYTSKSTNGSLVGFKPLEKTALRPDEWTCEPLFRGGVKETGNAD
ncbi:hypothetical protein [Rhizobium nepotum]|uniref:hypothetical protein n=1 Tax=Rhizobium nepotum TaxID=1035271 RepID=UPI003CF00063